MGHVKKSALASLMLVSESLAQKLVGLVSTLVLARSLLPDDFGIIAIGLLCESLVQALSHVGIQLSDAVVSILIIASIHFLQNISSEWKYVNEKSTPILIILIAQAPSGRIVDTP